MRRSFSAPTGQTGRTCPPSYPAPKLRGTAEVVVVVGGQGLGQKLVAIQSKTIPLFADFRVGKPQAYLPPKNWVDPIINNISHNISIFRGSSHLYSHLVLPGGPLQIAGPRFCQSWCIRASPGTRFWRRAAALPRRAESVRATMAPQVIQRSGGLQQRSVTLDKALEGMK